MKCWMPAVVASLLVTGSVRGSDPDTGTVDLERVLRAVATLAAGYPEPGGGDPAFRARLAADRRDFGHAISTALDVLADHVASPGLVARLGAITAGRGLPRSPRAGVAAPDLVGTSRFLRALAGEVQARKTRVPAEAFDEVIDAIEERPRAWAAEETAFLPRRLSDTGLYSDIRRHRVAPGILPFTPRYPLWSDGAAKSRWIRLPRGSRVDASRPDRWEFPAGTVLWKEFSFGGRPVETRLMVKVSRPASPVSWRYATYRWNDAGTDAILASPDGRADVAATRYGTRHDIPAVRDCLRCHSRGGDAVLGFDAVQLSGRILEVTKVTPSPSREAPFEAALGYLHGNCGHCHNPQGPVAFLGMDLRLALTPAGQRSGAERTAIGRLTRLFEVPGRRLDRDSWRIRPRDSTHSAITVRVAQRGEDAEPMPPIGTEAVDAEGLRLLRCWIESLRP